MLKTKYSHTTQAFFSTILFVTFHGHAQVHNHTCPWSCTKRNLPEELHPLQESEVERAIPWLQPHLNGIPCREISCLWDKLLLSVILSLHLNIYPQNFWLAYLHDNEWCHHNPPAKSHELVSLKKPSLPDSGGTMS